ncbi:hypothetical protein L917_19783 [Phytophthora nicotianae]|uniref:RxLR effector protein n=3 Tax=Phytophthora nicotianae TaxID=4792 RepID=W2QUP5_PHYN3|nr:hypothetical protein PPTG_05923 [Phytophthora nicotianae INRA-310]ETI32595.1 hypothetical protein F443_20630 [Phytophthora nicotianae P1569]ETL79629.1 hypothetical protein L917_19783 [Phytophthora nicotianae]ETM32873.1 hypothetical protein L914_19818 [Phytophthora nicotianae]ETN16813.1 hypothetical protein PPTG_05923 [Phytophthora nicotianae INRA-310]
MRTSFSITFALIAASFSSVGAMASGGLRGVNDVGSEERKLDQIDGSGSDDSIIWVEGSKPESEREYTNYHHGHQKKVCQINFPKNCWYVDIFDQ